MHAVVQVEPRFDGEFDAPRSTDDRPSASATRLTAPEKRLRVLAARARPDADPGEIRCSCTDPWIDVV